MYQSSIDRVGGRTQAAAKTARNQRYAAPQADNPTLQEALAVALRDRWHGTPSLQSTYSQARIAADAIASLVYQGGEEGSAVGETGKAVDGVRLGDVTAQHLILLVGIWRADGYSAGTINKRLTCLSVMGISVAGRYQRRHKVLKWWLKPDAEAGLVRSLLAAGDGIMADYITWTTRTGLRVEESLALTKADFSEDALDNVSVTVPGLKTISANATLPLGEEAVEVYRARFTDTAAQADRMFPIDYDVLLCKWNLCRIMLGVADNPLATLKALRRSAARYLHVTKGMPLDLVRSYLRHENVATTMEYLRLTGGYGTAEFRKWL